MTAMFPLQLEKLSSGSFLPEKKRNPEFICPFCFHIYIPALYGNGMFISVWLGCRCTFTAALECRFWARSLKGKNLFFAWTIRHCRAAALLFLHSLSLCSTRHWLSISFDTLKVHCYQPEWKFTTVLNFNYMTAAPHLSRKLAEACRLQTNGYEPQTTPIKRSPHIKIQENSLEAFSNLTRGSVGYSHWGLLGLFTFWISI